jgi:alpha-tubulin suppressor-like RCC1 family protein
MFGNRGELKIHPAFSSLPLSEITQFLEYHQIEIAGVSSDLHTLFWTYLMEHPDCLIPSVLIADFFLAYQRQGQVGQRYELADLHLMSDEELQELSSWLGLPGPDRTRVIRILGHLGLINQTLDKPIKKQKIPPSTLEVTNKKRKIFPKIISASVGQEHSLLLSEQGEVYGLGYNAAGQLGLPETRSSLDQGNLEIADSENQSTITPIPKMREISAGAYHSLFLSSTNQIYSCGYNNLGQLGLGHQLDIDIPTLLPNIEPIIALSAGDFHSLLLDIKGRAYSFGSNYFGQLGISDPRLPLVQGQVGLGQEDLIVPSPQMIDNLVSIVALAAGGGHSLFLDLRGQVWSCGLNQKGQLGIGDPYRRDQPTLIELTRENPMISIAAGGDHSLFLDFQGQVYSCGSNDWGQLGLSDTLSRSIPILIQEIREIKTLSAGRNHSLFLTPQGRVYGCGSNKKGRLGFGEIESFDIPTLMTIKDIVSLSAGGKGTLLIDSQGKIQTCGSNKRKQLGRGDSPMILVPTDLPILTL